MSGSLASVALAEIVGPMPPELAYRPGMPDAPPKLQKGAPRDRKSFHAAFMVAKAGNRERAIEGFKQTVRINPKDCDAHYNLGVTFFAASEFGKALDAFRMAIGVNSKLASAYFGVGCALGALGRSEDALDG